MSLAIDDNLQYERVSGDSRVERSPSMRASPPRVARYGSGGGDGGGGDANVPLDRKRTSCLFCPPRLGLIGGRKGRMMGGRVALLASGEVVDEGGC